MEQDVKMVIAIIGITIGLIFGVLLDASLMKHSLEKGKFCPECGAHYSKTDLYCVNDGEMLKMIGGN